MPIRQARGPLAWWLRLAGYAGITLPPFGIFLVPERFSDERLRRHELAHADQARRLGALRFYAVYLLLFARHGYDNHPMEIEARLAENPDATRRQGNVHGIGT